MVFFLYQSLRPAPSKRPYRSLDPNYGPTCTAATNRQCLSYSRYPWQRIVAPFDFVHSKCADEYLEQIQSMHCKLKWIIFVKLLFPAYILINLINSPINEQSEEQTQQNDVPEPYENVRFLIDDVQWQNAKWIVLLYRSGRTVLMENTFSHARKNVNHWINSLLLWSLGEIHHTQSIRHEFTVKEFVHQPHLNDNVDDAKELAHPVPNGVDLVALLNQRKQIIFRTYFWLELRK